MVRRHGARPASARLRRQRYSRHGPRHDVRFGSGYSTATDRGCAGAVPAERQLGRDDNTVYAIAQRAERTSIVEQIAHHLARRSCPARNLKVHV